MEKLITALNNNYINNDEYYIVCSTRLKIYENGNLKLYIFVHFFVYSLKKSEVTYT